MSCPRPTKGCNEFMCGSSVDGICTQGSATKMHPGIYYNPTLDRDFKAGDIVQHFKGGVYTILAIGTHTETKEKMVVYQSLKDQQVWVRPYEMFVSEVDKEKYPEVIQPYRLVKLELKFGEDKE